MSVVKIYDIVEMVIDEAEDQFKGHWTIPEDKRRSLQADCAIIDQLVSEFDCESAEADVDDETLRVRVSIVCPDIILEYGRTHPFFALIQRTESFGFSATEDSVKIDFIFAGLWEHQD